MSFSGFFDLASGGFLAAPFLISNCSSHGEVMEAEVLHTRNGGTEKASMPRSPTGSCLVLDIMNKRNFNQFVLNSLGTSLVVQWLIKTLPSKAGGMGLLPG